MKILAILLTLVTLGLSSGCQSLDIDSAQGAMEPYSLAIEGYANGLVAANARFIAVDAQVTLTVTFRRRDTVLWSQTFERGSGQRAYQIVFDENDEFVQMRPVSWEVAQASLTWLPVDPVVTP